MRRIFRNDGYNSLWRAPNFKAALLIIAMVLTGFNHSQAQLKKVAQSGMQFLKIGVGAQMAGRGEAGIAAIHNIDAIFWNPAGLAIMEGKQFIFTRNQWIADIAHNAFAFGINLGNIGTIGASFIFMDYGDFISTVRDPDDNNLGIDAGFIDDPGEASARGFYLQDLNPVDLAIGVAYARQFTDRFWMGAQVKLVHEDLGSNLIQRVDFQGNPLGPEEIVENKLWNIVVDFGTVYRPGVAGIGFAMTFQNFGPEKKFQVEEFPMPLTFKMGLSVNLNEAFNKLESPHHFILNIDTVKPNDFTQRLHLGAEYQLLDILFLRGGYKFNYDTESIAVGFGLKKKLGGVNWNIDLSYTKIDRFSSPLRFSIGGHF